MPIFSGERRSRWPGLAVAIFACLWSWPLQGQDDSAPPAPLVQAWTYEAGG